MTNVHNPESFNSRVEDGAAEELEAAIAVVTKLFADNVTRHPKEAVKLLTEALLAGESPKTYGERMAQMALQRAGHIARPA